MSNLRRVPVRQEDVFPDGLLFAGVEPAVDFDRRTEEDNQLRDKETKTRLWLVSVLDPTGDRGKREISVKIAADVQPVPPTGMMSQVWFSDLVLVPWVNEKNRSQLAFRASGFRDREPAPPSRLAAVGSKP